MLQTKAQLPDPPPALSACYRERISTKGKSADELVAARLRREGALEACAIEWPKWYDTVREANGFTVPKAAAKVASK